MQHRGFLTAGFTFFFTVCLWNSCDAITDTIKQWLLEQHIGMGTWAVYHGVVALSFGLIPFVAYLLYRFGQFQKGIVWIGFTVALFASTSLIIILIARHYIEPYSYLMGETSYLIKIPFERYWDYAVSAASVISAFLFLVVAYLHKNSVARKTSSEVID